MPRCKLLEWRRQLNRILVLRGFEFGAGLFPVFVKLVDFLLVVVHVLGDGGDGVSVAAFRGGHEFRFEFAAEGFGLRDIFFDFREFLFEGLYDLAALGDIVGTRLAVFLGAGLPRVRPFSRRCSKP